MTFVSATVSAQDQQAQPISRVELSMSNKIGTVTDDVWGFDAYYWFKLRNGAFGTLTVVDSFGVSGWMADAGIRVGWFQAWQHLYVCFGVGMHLKDLYDGTKGRWCMAPGSGSWCCEVPDLESSPMKYPKRSQYEYAKSRYQITPRCIGG